MECRASRRSMPERRWQELSRGLAALSLVALLFGGSGCARQEDVQAAGMIDAPVVTVRTLPKRTSTPGKARLVSNEGEKQESVEAPKPQPKPRRRRRRPRREPVNREPQPVVAAATAQPGKAEGSEGAESPGAKVDAPHAASEHAKEAAPRSAAPIPEHVIEPKAPVRVPDTAPEPEPTPNPDR